ncbi:MAG: DNA internalization-related competence protein ComEC/Rec2 [bacterium]
MTTRSSILQRRPALRMVMLFIVGIVLAELVTIPLWILLLLNTLLFLILVIMYSFSSVTVSRWIISSMIIVGAGWYLRIMQQQEIQDRQLIPAGNQEKIALLGALDELPVKSAHQFRLVITTRTLRRNDSLFALERRILVLQKLDSSKSISQKFHVGDEIFIEGELQPFPVPKNPGDLHYGRYLTLNGVEGVVQVPESGFVRLVRSNAGNYGYRWISSLQEYLFAVIDSLHPPDEAGFLKGIVFGYRANIPLDVKESFTNTGTIHILAVSGSNVAVVALVFYSLFGVLRIPKRILALATIGGLVCYMLVTGSSPSVVRATLMGIVLLLGSMFERKAEIYNSIAIAALILLIVNPAALFDVGFQLSFSAVISIVYFYPFLLTLVKKIPEKYEEIKAIDYILKLFAVSLAAQIGTLPFTAFYFGRISIISILANLIVVPISGINVMLGLTTILIAPLSGWIASTYAALNTLLVKFLLGFVKAAASVPFAFIDIQTLSVTIVTLYYLIVLVLFSLGNMKRFKLWLIILLLFLNGAVYFSIFTGKERSLAVTMLDVGQGDALLVGFPNGKKVLIDTGPGGPNWSSGEKIIIPYLRKQGIESLDAILLTHAHSDHIGGLEYILKTIPVREIFAPAEVISSNAFRRINEKLPDSCRSVVSLTAGQQVWIDSSTRCYVLYPRQQQKKVNNINNTSLVFKLQYGNTSMMFVGDAESDVESTLMDGYRDFLDTDVLKVGHHGSTTSSSNQFLDGVTAQIALISVGRNNKFNHPSQETLQKLNQRGVSVHRTDQEGAILLSSNGRTFSTVDWR